VKTVHDASADAFTAIAHPTRRQLLDLLVAGEQSVSQLADHFPVTRPAISQHLKVLLDAGLASERREGRERLYRLEPEPLKDLDEWLERYRQLWHARLDRLDDYLQELQREEKDDGQNDSED
jgi:DNA-binding transcriptional ArsR family regulator